MGCVANLCNSVWLDWWVGGVCQSNLEHMKLQQRLEEVAAFRGQHQRFCQVRVMAVRTSRGAEAAVLVAGHDRLDQRKESHL